MPFANGTLKETADLAGSILFYFIHRILSLPLLCAEARCGFKKAPCCIKEAVQPYAFREAKQATDATADIFAQFKALRMWGNNMLRIFIAGQKQFGADVYTAVKNAGYTITGIACPNNGQHYDRLKKAAWCDPQKPVIIDSEKLLSADIPSNTDVLIAAHAHHFISEKVREQVKYAIGYHPSLLPRHRGRDAVKWTIRFGDPIAGGTVYMLDDKVDGGDIICQEAILVNKKWTDKDLWREALFPLGIKLILSALAQIDAGTIEPIPQDISCATWEPPIVPGRLYRPELIRLEHTKQTRKSL